MSAILPFPISDMMGAFVQTLRSKDRFYMLKPQGVFLIFSLLERYSFA